MKKSIYIFLSAALLGLASCGNEPAYVPGEEGTANHKNVYFPISEERGLELDPESTVTTHDVLIEREDATEALTVPLKVVVNTKNVFSVPESVTFEAGEAQKTITFSFGEMEIAESYKLRLMIDLSVFNPYQRDTFSTGELISPYYDFEITKIKYEPATGIFYDDALTGYGGESRRAWYVTYETATLPSGDKKVRIINPYYGIATSVDEDGIFDACPYGDEEVMLEDADYNAYITVSVDGVCTIETFYLGIDWGYGPIYLSQYGANGVYVDSLGLEFSTDEGALVCGDDDGPYNYAGFTLYFSKEAYLEDTYVEPAEATVEDYEGDFLLIGTDFDTKEQVEIPVTIFSDEDEDGQYYVINGIHEDAPYVFGYFNEGVNTMSIQASYGEEVEDEDGNVYQTYFYPIDNDGYANGRVTLDFVLAENGSLQPTDDTKSQAFSLVYENVDDEEDYFFGFGLYDIYFEPQEAAETLKKISAKHTRRTKTSRHVTTDQKQRKQK